MSRITNFNWEQFWETQNKYNDMMSDIEDRVLEIANDLGERFQPHQITDVFFQHDQLNEYVVAEIRQHDNEENFEYYKINAKWLFSDNYKLEIDKKDVERKKKEAEEYREYLRLKQKFENKCSED